MNINHNGGGESKRARGNRPQKYTGTERVHCLTFSVSTNKKSHCIPNSSHCHQTAHKNRHAQKINSTLYTAAFSLKRKKEKKKKKDQIKATTHSRQLESSRWHLLFYIYIKTPNFNWHGLHQHELNPSRLGLTTVQDGLQASCLNVHTCTVHGGQNHASASS